MILCSAENRSKIGPQLHQFCFQHRLNLDIQNILNSLRIKDFQVTYLEVTLVSMVKVDGGDAKKSVRSFTFHACFDINRYNYKIKLPACSDTKPNLNITVGTIPKKQQKNMLPAE